MFNDKYLAEVNFWRDVLSDGQPRFTLNFGSQSLVISTNLISFDVEWPGIPNDEMAFINQSYDEDLFTTAEWKGLTDREPITWDDGDEDDYEYDADLI